MYRTLTKEDKKYLSAIAIFVFIVLVVTLNMIFAPLILLAILLYVINNKNNAITQTELAVIALFGVPFILYCIIARLFGMTIGIFVVIPAIIFALILLIYKRMGGGSI